MFLWKKSINRYSIAIYSDPGNELEINSWVLTLTPIMWSILYGIKNREKNMLAPATNEQNIQNHQKISSR